MMPTRLACGRRPVSASGDKTVRVWDMLSARERAELALKALQKAIGYVDESA